MPNSPKISRTGTDQRYLLVVAIVLAVIVFAFTWVGIKESRSDSFALLVSQGTALTEALAVASENAITAEAQIDHLVHMRFHELVELIASDYPKHLQDQLDRLVVRHDLEAIYVVDFSGTISSGSGFAGESSVPPDFVIAEAEQLIREPESRFSLLVDETEAPGGDLLYYLEIANRLDQVTIIVADAAYYLEALEQTQIGYLAQDMARERGVEYIMYQSTEGIIFSSRRMGEILSIESDPFLVEALESDTVVNRTYDFFDRELLELVRPFSSSDYPFGLLRVGLSLDGYFEVSRGFDRLMLTLSGLLFCLVLIMLLYLNSRARRYRLSREFVKMKSVTDQLFDEMATGIAAVDSEGTITLCNHAFDECFVAGGSQGRRWNEVVTADRLSHALLVDALSVTEEIALTEPERVLLIATSQTESSTDQPAGFVAVVSDVTRLRQLEHDVSRRKRLSDMGDLAAGVAHEIRNPLNAISIAAQRLASEFVPEAGRELYLSFTQQIRAETKRLNQIITKFLALAHEEQTRNTSIDLKSTLDDICTLLKIEADQLNIELSLSVPGNIEVVADPNHLRQLFSNLFNNAKEALAGQPGKITIHAAVLKSMAVIKFADNGPGIDASLREKVLTPYFTTKEAGTGLGLPTVHRIITDMGGDLNIESGEQGGAVIVISIPVKSQ